MIRRATLFLLLVALSGLFAAPANAAFGLHDLDVVFENENGSMAYQAGSHPYAMKTTVAFNTRPSSEFGFEVPDEDPRDIAIGQIPGFIGDPSAVPPCTSAEFAVKQCPASSQVGVVDIGFQEPGFREVRAVYSLAPPPGAALTLGWNVSAVDVPITVDARVSESQPHNVVVSLSSILNVVPVYDSVVTLWGVPAASAHDSQRRGLGCGNSGCSVNIAVKPFLTLPRACEGPLPTSFFARSWEGSTFEETILTHDEAVPPNPTGTIGCGNLNFAPSIAAKPSSKAASSPTGLDVSLTVDDEGLSSPDGQAQSDVKEAVVTLPEGMTANPSVAEGLAVCSEPQLARETAASKPGEGCPEQSKIGSVRVKTPLLDETLDGALYQATPYANLANDALIGLYVVIKNADLGILVRQPIEVKADPQTGQLQGIARDIPQLPFSSFELDFREGARSPLISPERCGTHKVTALLTPWAGGAPVTSTSTFEIVAGPEGRPCPQGGTPPFEPGFQAGTVNNDAGSYSPFLMRWTRRDGDQDITRFSAKLPPGVVAKLAGATQCPQAAIAAARSKSGLAEKTSPSCPLSSQIGSVIAGSGVGSELLYVPGKVYLAGPYKGAPLSAVGIVPAVAGPFDVGTVVTQLALRIDPRSAEVSVDGSSSDPIPHILAGIPLKVRDIRANVDRPNFTLNPTSCNPFQVGATLWGSGNDLFGSGDDNPVALSERFQAANCASLGFAPKLTLKLKGGTRRGDFPALTGTYVPRPGDANLQGLVLRFPNSAFLEQAHIGTICTRPQFAAKACPAAAAYGTAKAWTPILEQPLEGPVYLRANGGERQLPDLVADLRGLVDVEAVAYIDSRGGGIRATFAGVPDAPLSKVVVSMRGGRKGLIVNSVNLCAKRQKANASFSGHNGRRATLRPVLQAKCSKKGRKGQARAGG
ncbi:MAG TPA: hypothetical protein VFY48_09670 [Solirubrobacterales bacterium]|nr:hypothetical protein [Solirubrobacterales bacterium]